MSLFFFLFFLLFPMFFIDGGGPKISFPREGGGRMLIWDSDGVGGGMESLPPRFIAISVGPNSNFRLISFGVGIFPISGIGTEG